MRINVNLYVMDNGKMRELTCEEYKEAAATLAKMLRVLTKSLEETVEEGPIKSDFDRGAYLAYQTVLAAIEELYKTTGILTMESENVDNN